jgi:hypothetical protein
MGKIAWLLAAVAAIAAASLAPVRPTVAAQTEYSQQLPSITDNFSDASWRVTCDPESACLGGELGTDGTIRFSCNMSHMAYDDPILAFGQPGAVHLHHFFGNTMASAVSTFNTLRTTGSGSCAGGPLNRTAYWIPAMINRLTGKVVKPRGVLFYYKNEPVNRYLTEPTPYIKHSAYCPASQAVVACPTYSPRFFARGMEAIAGRDLDGTTGNADVTFTCVKRTTGVNNFSKTKWYDTADLANSFSGASECPADTHFFELGINTPRCWDGNLTVAGGRTLWAGPLTGNPAGCAVTHPYLLPLIQAFIIYDHDGEADYSNWRLSSDIYNGADYALGSTYHMDFKWAWSPVIAAVIEDVVWDLTGDGEPRTTNDGILGDGTTLLQGGHVDATTPLLTPAARELDMP